MESMQQFLLKGWLLFYADLLGGMNMYNPVVSNEYEVALHILKGMLQKGLISKEEFFKIDAENKRTFLGDKTPK